MQAHFGLKKSRAGPVASLIWRNCPAHVWLERSLARGSEALSCLIFNRCFDFPLSETLSRAIGAIPSLSEDAEIDLNCTSVGPIHIVGAASLYGAPEAQYHCNATLPGQEGFLIQDRTRGGGIVR